MLTAIPQRSPALSFPGVTHQGLSVQKIGSPACCPGVAAPRVTFSPHCPRPSLLGHPQAVNNAPHKFTFQAASLVRAGLGARRPIQPRNEFPWTPAASFET